MLTEFVFKFLDRIGPVDRLGRLVVVSDVVAERRVLSLIGWQFGTEYA